MTIQNLQKIRNEMRDDFFKAYPDPSCKERATWRSMTGMINNAYDGDIIGGETGHANSAYENALKTLSRLKEKMEENYHD